MSVVDAGLPPSPLVTAEDLARITQFPRDADGKLILLEVGGVPLAVGEVRRDAIGAAARCRDLQTACILVTPDLDACVAQLPLCGTDRPWEEAPCCPRACVSAYQEERRLGAPVLKASRAVFGSTHECFSGLQELYRASGGVPYLAPRLAP